MDRPRGWRTSALDHLIHPSDLYDGADYPGPFEPHEDEPDEHDSHVPGTVRDPERALSEDQDQDDRRSRDLAPRAPTPPPPRRLPGTRRQGGREAYLPRFDVIRAQQEAGVPLSVSRSYEDMSAERATRWLKENDPIRTVEGVQARVTADTSAGGLSLVDLAEAFKPGRPTAARQEIRSRLRAALDSVWGTGAERDHIARALGTSRESLYKLMGAKP